VPFHEKSGYGLRFDCWPCFSRVNYQKQFVEIVQKETVFFRVMGFLLLKIF